MQEDVLKREKTVYTIHKYYDGTHTIYINGSAKDDGTEIWKQKRLKAVEHEKESIALKFLELDKLTIEEMTIEEIANCPV